MSQKSVALPTFLGKLIPWGFCFGFLFVGIFLFSGGFFFLFFRGNLFRGVARGLNSYGAQRGCEGVSRIWVVVTKDTQTDTVA